ncbi:tRNA-dihydrouridine(47) synthase [NAD(P)(+)]-like protein [Kappamyces sp. JEL0680]|nr:tRNA-dihydrouridine(47) synthase [NAD(P)(+)]-like protein [Kappamyces sp. JEL0680]
MDTNDVRLRRQEKKKLDFRGKTYLAPLTTVGNLPFRRICKGFGVDVTCAEMSLSHNLLTGIQNEWALMKRHASEDLFGIQVTGNHPVSFSKLCEVINQNLEVDFVDINLGCPVEAITSKGCGSALLERRSKLKEIVLGANYVLDCPLTVKIRTGVRNKTRVAHKLIPQFQSWGVAGITLHGRSTEQRYTRLADWEYIEECSQLIDRSSDNYPFFFGNGDCLSPQDYFDHLKTPTIDGVMIGRGALIKPWIFEEIKRGQLWDISASERLDMLKDYASFGLAHWGSDTQGVNQTRTFMCEWLSFLYRYVPVGLIEVLPQKINLRPERFAGRNELETLMASDNSRDWIKITELVLGKAPDSFSFIPKHRSNSYESSI